MIYNILLMNKNWTLKGVLCMDSKPLNLTLDQIVQINKAISGFLSSLKS